MTRPQTWTATTPTALWQEKELAPSGADSDATLRITDDRAQQWRGFGGCFNELGWIALSRLDAAVRADILDELFAPDGAMRFNYCRLPIGASDYGESWYSANEHDGDFAMERFSLERDERHLVPYIREALARRPDMTLFASPWSPPTWLKRPQACNFGTLVQEPAYLDAYALYLLKFVQSYRALGIDIASVFVQNEPDSDQKFPSCRWTGAQMRDFIRDYLGPLFARENEPCEIWAGTFERPDYDAWANVVLSDPAARAFVSGVGYQWAGRDAVQRTHQAWPDVPIIQTENECGRGDNPWAHAAHVFELLHHYIANGVVAYVYWNFLLAEGGHSTWGWSQNAMISVDMATTRLTRNPEYYVMKHFARFVEPGAAVLRVEGRWSADAVAFVNPDGTHICIVHNPFDEARPLALDTGAEILNLTLDADSYNTFVLPE
jgi:glucosylceramidase